MKHRLIADEMLTVVNNMESYNRQFQAGTEFERCCFVHGGVILRAGDKYVFVKRDRLAECFEAEKEKKSERQAPWRFTDESEMSNGN